MAIWGKHLVTMWSVCVCKGLKYQISPLGIDKGVSYLILKLGKIRLAVFGQNLDRLSWNGTALSAFYKIFCLEMKTPEDAALNWNAAYMWWPESRVSNLNSRAWIDKSYFCNMAILSSSHSHWADQSAKWANLRSDQCVLPAQTQGRWLFNGPTTALIPYLTQRCRLVQHRSSIWAGRILQNKETSNCGLSLSLAHLSQFTNTWGGQQSNGGWGHNISMMARCLEWSLPSKRLTGSFPFRNYYKPRPEKQCRKSWEPKILITYVIIQTHSSHVV